MKTIIMFSLFFIAALILYAIFGKISILDTYFNLGNSLIWIDIVFLLMGLCLVIPRGIAVYQKLFN